MIKFDTRDKKPKIYNIAVLSVAAVAAVIILLVSGAEKHGLAIGIIESEYFLAVAVMLIIAFFKQMQYNPYSYNTIYYMGFALFIFSVLITHVILTIQIGTNPEYRNGVTILGVLLSSAKQFMLISAPFIVLFSIALFASNISLIIHEGKRLVNILGIILSFILVGGEVFLFFSDYYVSGSVTQVVIHELFTNTFAAIYLYFECMLLGGMTAEYITAGYKPQYDKDFLIILGCGIRQDGTPTPLLKGRVDKALEFAEKQKQLTGKDLIFVTSGGQGPREVISESDSMANYLIEQGIPSERIIREDKSTDTFENMKFSKDKIQAVNPDGKVAFSTTNYHVFRSGLYARRVKMRAVGMGAKTKWYFWPNASVREFVGLLTEHRGKQILIFGCLIAIYIVLTLLYYKVI